MRPARFLFGRVPGPSADEDPRPSEGWALPILVVLLLGLIVYGAGSGTSVEWALALLGLSLLAAFAWRRVLRGTADPGPLVDPAEPGPIRSGELEALALSARRASRGLPFSQVVVTSRARAACSERVRLALGLSPEAMREAEADPAALRRLTRDDTLADFLHLRTGSLEDRYGWVLRARGRGGFAREFRDVLDRMEAWR